MSSPTVSQWELSVRIRNRRHELGLDAASVSKRMGVSRNYWSAVENDRTLLAEDKVKELGLVLQFTDAEIEELLALLADAKGPRWWDEYDSLLDDDLAKIIGLEQGSRRIRFYEVQIFPGLLQSDEYATEVIGSDPHTSRVSTNQRVELRRRRRELLTGDDPPELTVLLGEGVLRQHYGPDPLVLARQLDHLIELKQTLEDRMELHVLPFTERPLGLTGGSTLILLDFDSEHLSTVMWREALTPIGITEDPEEVDVVEASFEQAIAESALGEEDSLALLAGQAQDLRRS